MRRVSGIGGWRVLLGGAVCAGIVAGCVSPVWAGEAEQPAGGSALGSFALSDGLEGTIGEVDGSFGFTVTVAGVPLGWSSAAARGNPHGLGHGWALPYASMQTTGGVTVFPASGGAFEMNQSEPSGLQGYPDGDVVFRVAEPGATVPARADGTVDATPFAYVLRELGGVSTYFSEAGDPVARIDETTADRMDLQWAPGGTHRLTGIVNRDGVRTTLAWTGDRVTVTPGANVTTPVEGSGGEGEWVIELDDEVVSAIVDPAGGRTSVTYDARGLVERVSAPSGSSTAVTWAPSIDGVARVGQVRIVDDLSGAELSRREWSATGAASVSGWPVADAWAAGAAGALSYDTVLSDGVTAVSSSFDAGRVLTHRSVIVTTKAGRQVVQEQAFGYPDRGAVPGAVRAVKPSDVTLTYRNEVGATRSAAESYEFDRWGRMLARTTADGAVTTRRYDDVVPEERGIPVGLVTEETVTAADGLVRVTKRELSADRTEVLATEQWSGRSGQELVRTGRVETDVDAGVVTEQRVFPVGPAETIDGVPPVVTRWSQQIDVAAGTRTVTETAGAGTPIQTSTTSVSSLVHGGVLSTTDPVGNRASSWYDEAGKLIASVDTAGLSATREYRTRQADGVNAAVVTGPDGVTVTEEFDALGRVTRKHDDIAPTGNVVDGYERVFETRDYTDPGVEEVTDAWGAVTTTELDVFGRVSRVDLPNGLVQVVERDDVGGTATSGVTPTGSLADAEQTQTVTLDPVGQHTAKTGTRADGVEVPRTVTEYDGLGRVVRSGTTTTGTATETRTGYDAYGRPATTSAGAADPEAEVGVESEHPAAGAGIVAERRYDAFGSSVEKTMRSGDDTRPGEQRVLDELGRTVALTDQRGVTERMNYTVDGLIEQVTSDTGRQTTHRYDPSTRALVETTVTAPNAPTVATAYQRDDLGRVIAVFDPADEAGTAIRYEYDAFGNRVRVEYPDGSDIRHEYDAHGRPLAMIDVDDNRTEYAYDPDGTLRSATQTDRTGTPVSAVAYEYDDHGRVSRLTRDNGVVTEYTFTSAGQVETETTTAPEGTLSEREYEYAPTGSLSSRIDRVPGPGQTPGDGAPSAVTRTEYVYDALDRLVQSTIREGDTDQGRIVTRTEYVPTVGGDLETETITNDPDSPDETTVTRRFEYSAAGELTAVHTGDERAEQSHTADAQVAVAAGGARYSYDAAGRPVTQTTAEGTDIETGYWPDGTRRHRSTDQASTTFYWDGTTLVNEVHAPVGAEQAVAATGGVASYLLGVTRHARTVHPAGGEPATEYYTHDRHGNVTNLTDQHGRITTSYTYTDYGVATATGEPRTGLPARIGELAINPYQYAGEYTDPDGTQFLRERVYAPALAHFLAKDQELLANRFAFGNLNPIMNVDPTGREAEKDWLHVGITTGGFVASLVGAALLLTTTLTGGLAALGAFGLVMAGGDAVFAGFQVANALATTKFMDPKATEIASWSVLAIGIGLTIAGAAAKLLARGAVKNAASKQEEVILREDDAPTNIKGNSGHVDETASLIKDTQHDVEDAAHDLQARLYKVTEEPLRTGIGTWRAAISTVNRSDAVSDGMRELYREALTHGKMAKNAASLGYRKAIEAWRKIPYTPIGPIRELEQESLKYLTTASHELGETVQALKLVTVADDVVANPIPDLIAQAEDFKKVIDGLLELF